jgi:hypothetical protein
MASRIVNPNLATDTKLRAKVESELLPLVKRVRTDRKQMRETWLRYYWLWACVRDQQAYSGRSQTFIGTTRKIIENWTRRIVRDLFPSSTDGWFANKAMRRAFESREATIHTLFQYFFTKHTQLRRQATPWVRQGVTLGTSPVKVVWRHEEREIEMLRDVFDEEGNPTGNWKRVVERVTDFVGPTFRPVDLHAFFVYPVTVQDVNDAEAAWEELLVPRERVRQLAKTPVHPDDDDQGMMFENVEELLELVSTTGSSGKARDKFDAEARRLSDKGFTHRLDMRLPAALRPIDYTELTWKRDLLGTGKPQRWLIGIGADQVPVRIQQVPFWHGRAHWLAMKFLEVQNEFYGHGLPELIDRLNYTLIDVADQATDALVWCMNPITVVDMFAVQDPTSLRMRPGAKWLAQIAGVKFIEPPKETAAVGFQAVSQYRSLMHELADIVPLQGGIPKSRGRAKESTSGMQLAITEAQIDVKEVVESVEVSVMVPFLRMTHSLAQQFMPDKLILQVAGADGASMVEKQITPQDVIGDFEFEWLGSVQSTNLQVRAQQLLTFFGIVSKIPPEVYASQNIEVDLKYLLREIYGTGLGMRGADRVIRDKVKQDALDWRLENELFRNDRAAEVTISEQDNHVEHAEGHYHLLTDPKVPPHLQRAVFKHLRGHVAAQLAQQMLKAQQEQQRQLGGAPGGAPGAGNGARLKPPLGPGRVAQTTDLSDVLRTLPRAGA